MECVITTAEQPPRQQQQEQPTPGTTPGTIPGTIPGTTPGHAPGHAPGHVAGNGATVAGPPKRRRKRRKPPPRPSAFPHLTPQEWQAISDAYEFTLRQMQVVQGKFEEHTHADIARSIDRTVGTVEKHWAASRRLADVDTPIQMMHKIYAIVIDLRVEAAKKAALAATPHTPQADPPPGESAAPLEPPECSEDAPVGPVPENRMLPPVVGK